MRRSPTALTVSVLVACLLHAPACTQRDEPPPTRPDAGQSLVASAPASGIAAADSARIAGEIASQNAALGAAYLRNDAAAVAAIYAADAVLRSVEGSAQDLRGRAAIEATFRRLFATSPVAEATLETIALRVWPDSALEDGRFAFEYAPREAAPSVTTGSSHIRWRRDADGVWRIVEDRAVYDEEQ